MSRLKKKKKPKVKVLTAKSRIIKKTHKKLDKGISQDAKAKMKEITDSMKGDPSKLDSLNKTMREAFTNVSEIESYLLEMYLLKEWEEKLKELEESGEGGLENVDLQNVLEKQQQTLQTMSNMSKALHDTAMAIIRKMG